MIEKLVVDFFQRIEKNERIITKHGKAVFLVDLIFKKSEREKHLNDNISKISMSNSTATRLYEKYIENKKGSNLKNSFFKDAMAEYLGYEDYNDFINKNQPTIIPTADVDNFENTFTHTEEIKKRNWKKVIGISSILLIGILYFSYQSFIINTSTCIIWNGKNYEKTSCATYKAISNIDSTINIKKFKKIDVDQNSNFFENGVPIIWHGKNHNGIIEYFSYEGKHPQTKEILKKVTRHFLAKHGLLLE